MIDRKKVIKGLMVCVDRIPGKYNCNECPYEIDGNNCEINMTMDAIALLKEQLDIVRCKECCYGEKANAVYLCGKNRGFGIAHEPNWFCADGKKK